MQRNLIVGLSLLLLIGCEPHPDSTKLLDELVVSTSYDTKADFTSYSTYAIPTDTIGFYSNASNDTIIVQSQSDFPRPVLQAIQSNLDTRGYSRVARKDNPDLGVNVAVINDFNVFQQVVYPGGYGGYGGYGYGYYYPYYYGYGSYYSPYVNTYTSNTGVLIIELVDLKNRTLDNKVRTVWTANMGDVYSTIDLLKQTEDAINQAFIQSPYIDKP